MKIWKWGLRLTDRQEVAMPRGARLLDVQMQGDTCCLWAVCDEHAPIVTRCVGIYGTGNPIPDDLGEYIATFPMYGGSLIFHAFDQGELP